MRNIKSIERKLAPSTTSTKRGSPILSTFRCSLMVRHIVQFATKLVGHYDCSHHHHCRVPLCHCHYYYMCQTDTPPFPFIILIRKPIKYIVFCHRLWPQSMFPYFFKPLLTHFWPRPQSHTRTQTYMAGAHTDNVHIMALKKGEHIRRGYCEYEI